MRLPRVQFTVRRMMAVVAVAAAMTWVLGKPYYDRTRWGSIASYHYRQADLYQAKAAKVSNPDEQGKLFSRFQWHQAMAARYARAAAYPGMPAPTELPPP